MDYSYQEALVERVIKTLYRNHKAVLAACPGAGKTHMTLEIVKRFLQDKPDAKILILTNGQVLLRNQWHAFLTEKGLRHGIIFSSRLARITLAHHSVVVALPQSLRGKELPKIDLLIIDEAHHRYLRQEVQAIIDQTKPDYELPITGTPSLFVDRPEYETIGISIEELLPLGVVCDPVVELVQMEYQYGLNNYNPSTMQLRRNLIFDAQSTKEVIQSVFDKLMEKLTSENRANPEAFNWVTAPNDWVSLAKHLKKTLIIANNQRHALDIGEYFAERQIKAIVNIHYLTDGIAELEQFMTTDAPIMIVVIRGILGFNYTELMNVIDLSGTLNVNRNFQQLCRVIRPSTENPKQRKLYIKGTNAEMAPLTYMVMSFVIALSTKEYYYQYSTDFTKRTIPVRSGFVYEVGSRFTGDKEPRRLPDLPALLTFTELIKQKGLGTIAYSSLSTAIASLGDRPKEFMTVKQALVLAKRCRTRRQFAVKHQTANNYLQRVRLMSLLDDIFGPVFRWTQITVEEKIATCSTITQFKTKYMGAYKWLKKHDQLYLLNALGISNLTNDTAIKHLLLLSDFTLTEKGEVFWKKNPIAIGKQNEKRGYRFKIQGEYYPLGRCMWLKFKGQIPKGMYVKLKSPELMPHLENWRLSTRSNNGSPLKNNKGNGKIDRTTAEAIRKAHSEGESYNKIIKRFPISKSTVSYIVTNRTWRSDEPPANA